MSLIMIIDLLFRLYIIIIRKSWFEGPRVGGPRGLAKNRDRFDSIPYDSGIDSNRYAISRISAKPVKG